MAPETAELTSQSSGELMSLIRVLATRVTRSERLMSFASCANGELGLELLEVKRRQLGRVTISNRGARPFTRDVIWA